ncbi:hypothetical protein [Pedobacter sp. SYSU D00535]|uniref:hypothetical protein n=1 Tax=Pedobacter sp. SYSU D00535 TaxID=2810308 RepID=UPI001A96E0B7|nr:hypothetical protein [Pedobacter sp. SYSU D00535]
MLARTSELMRTSFFLLLMLALSQLAFAQTLIDVTDQTLKIAARTEEDFFYSFAEGDKIIISLQELNEKELKSFEVVELPGNTVFADYKTTRINSKTLKANKNSIYKFSISNSSLSGRVCKLKIQRVPFRPANATHNTSVYREVRGDSVFFSITERYLKRSDTVAVSLVNQIAKVSSRSALNQNSNQTIVDFTLPAGTVSWAYYIGVGTEGMKAEAEARSKFLNTSASLLSKFEGYGTMAALALYGINAFDKAQGDDNVKYWFLPGWEQVQKYRRGQKFTHYKQGNVVNDAVQMKSPVTGKIFLALENDNLIEPIDVLVKVTAVQVKQQWATRTVRVLALKAIKRPVL